MTGAQAFADAMAAGDAGSLRERFTDDVRWHVAGNHGRSGDFVGRDGLLAYLGGLSARRDTGAAPEVLSALDSDRQSSVLVRVEAERDGQRLDIVVATVMTIGPDGRWDEYWTVADDQDAVDAFFP